MAIHRNTIQMLQKLDEHQQRNGGAEASIDGRQVMDEVAGSQVTEDRLWRGFIRELESAGST